ncbi:MAG: AAA family ATPase [Chitinispirillales bacterium]|nr:AAA family ATPase [Chitinispirillales bacterium]
MDKLRPIHPFFGITFLSCKKNDLPIGEQIEYQMDASNKSFLDGIHRLDSESKFYYQPYKSNSKDVYWVRHDYASSGLQAINTQTFMGAFLHTSTKTWGWKSNYVLALKALLKHNKKSSKLPLSAMAIWVLREEKRNERDSLKEVVDRFLSMFHISQEEREYLFSDDVVAFSKKHSISFQESPVSWEDFRTHVKFPPDAAPVRGAALSCLELENVGPAERLYLEPSSRLNMVTGDNGLGKSFIMECAWWAFTGKWIDSPAMPFGRRDENKPRISFALASNGNSDTAKTTAHFDFKTREWSCGKSSSSTPGLIVYARVDGSYAVWEPIRQESYCFSRTDVWEGVNGKIEGLIRDWVKWQSTPEKYPFKEMLNVLKKVSPPDMGELQPGYPMRMFDDTREIPTIIHPYGSVPITHVSAGIRRIVALAYLMVWAWHEHTVLADITGNTPERRMVILIDELEAHLHPKWQRAILPALIEVQSMLSESLESTQFLISTHSPLVLASVETVFNEQSDKLFGVYANDKTGCAELRNIDFIKYGRIDSWLTSDIFELQQARSREAEDAISEAKRLQIEKKPILADIFSTHLQLLRCLSETDTFWPRWLYFAESNGVDI